MGDYLSTPNTNKESSDVEGTNLRCGFSSMQGWRTSQEDAHNCIIDFDENVSLFAVYDGHGGNEVSEYCSKKLPDFIKKTENYSKGEYEEALKEAFLGFDKMLKDPDVIEELKKIRVEIKTDLDDMAPGSSDSECEEAVSNLMQEARMPLDEVMKRYQAKLKLGGEKPMSPMLRARRVASSTDGAGSSSSSAYIPSDVAENGDSTVTSSSSKEEMCNGVGHTNGEVSDSADSEVNEKNEDEESINKEETRESVTSSTTNEEAAPAEGGDCLPLKRNVLSRPENYKDLIEEDDSDTEEEDATFTADQERYESEGSDDDTSENDDEEETSSDECNVAEMDDNFYGCEMPGRHSGSTAVLALLVERQLFVANIGDSRCVVGRNDGKAVEMSFDHKPEDIDEKKRIENAGGVVSVDGRVNGGLNLSRAFGDHSYKQNPDLLASQQMITALPDVQSIIVDPDKHKFMVIACDGIWNSMSSQEVVDFVHKKLEKKTERLSEICEALFDNCMAPNTLGDGTGCDNMTCVIVLFKSDDKPADADSTSTKRPAEDVEEPDLKRSRVEEVSSA